MQFQYFKGNMDKHGLVPEVVSERFAKGGVSSARESEWQSLSQTGLPSRSVGRNVSSLAWNPRSLLCHHTRFAAKLCRDLMDSVPPHTVVAIQEVHGSEEEFHNNLRSFVMECWYCVSLVPPGPRGGGGGCC